MATKKSIFQAHLDEWLGCAGDRRKRGALARAIAHIAKVHLKSVPRSFRRVQLHDSSAAEQRGRPLRYTPDVTTALKALWDIAGGACGENLHPVIPEYVAVLRRDRLWSHDAETTAKLLAMSEGTVKLRVQGFARARGVLHGKSTTKPGSILAMIPIRSDGWDEAPAGTMQTDTVAHCGHTTEGDFAYTVNGTDVPTLWGARRAQWNKGREATIASMETMTADVPFRIVEWHPDSGSEFINWQCKTWCDARGVRLTRSRPNHKNDNCYVEERNGHVVRAYVGYARFDAREAVAVLNDLYDVLTPFLNHFIANKRIVSKQRIGARWKIQRERSAKTPYQRVLEREDVSNDVKVRMRAVHATLNPLLLKQAIDRRIQRVFDIQKRHGRPGRL